MLTKSEARKAWVDALRSGNFSQTAGYLERLDPETHKPIGNCCLGVLCRLAIADGVGLEAKPDSSDSNDPVTFFGPEDERPANGDLFLSLSDGKGSRVVAPIAVMEWAGLVLSDGGYGDEGDTLASRNDDGASFGEIANIIESEPDGMFVDV